MKLAPALRHYVAVAMLTSTAFAQGNASFSDIYVFGDSLSDNGNLFAFAGIPAEPYWQGRFSNGRVWVEQLAEALGQDPDTIRDFAVGGSTTRSVFQSQIGLLMVTSGGQLPSDALYIYWAGANDLFDLLSAPGNPQAVIGDAMAQTAAALIALAHAGARTMVVANLPNLALTPRVVALGDPAVTAGAEGLAAAYNGALAQTIAQLEMAFGMHIIEVDMFALTDDIVNDPKKYLFKIVDEAVIREDGKLRIHAERFLFFDDIHPTFTGHRVLMRAGLRALGVPIPGDVDGNFIVNVADMKALKKAFGRCGSPCPADLNGDGMVDHKDKKILQEMLWPKSDGGHKPGKQKGKMRSRSEV